MRFSNVCPAVVLLLLCGPIQATAGVTINNGAITISGGDVTFTGDVAGIAAADISYVRIEVFEYFDNQVGNSVADIAIVGPQDAKVKINHKFTKDKLAQLQKDKKYRCVVTIYKNVPPPDDPVPVASFAYDFFYTW